MGTCKKVAVFVDSDNVSPALFGQAWGEIKDVGEIVYGKAYGDWDRLTQMRKVAEQCGLSLHNQKAYVKGKNATDMALAVDCVDAYTSTEFELAFIFSGDSDFTPLCEYLKKKGVYVVGVSEKEKMSDAFCRECDENLDLKELAELSLSKEQRIYKEDPLRAELQVLKTSLRLQNKPLIFSVNDFLNVIKVELPFSLIHSLSINEVSSTLKPFGVIAQGRKKGIDLNLLPLLEEEKKLGFYAAYFDAVIKYTMLNLSTERGVESHLLSYVGERAKNNIPKFSLFKKKSLCLYKIIKFLYKKGVCEFTDSGHPTLSLNSLLSTGYNDDLTLFDKIQDKNPVKAHDIRPEEKVVNQCIDDLSKVKWFNGTFDLSSFKKYLSNYCERKNISTVDEKLVCKTLKKNPKVCFLTGPLNHSVFEVLSVKNIGDIEKTKRIASLLSTLKRNYNHGFFFTPHQIFDAMKESDYPVQEEAPLNVIIDKLLQDYPTVFCKRKAKNKMFKIYLLSSSGLTYSEYMDAIFMKVESISFSHPGKSLKKLLDLVNPEVTVANWQWKKLYSLACLYQKQYPLEFFQGNKEVA